MESYQKGLGFEPDNKACRDGLQKTMTQINSGMAGGQSEDEQKERAAHAMADPEIQMILTDPVVRQVQGGGVFNGRAPVVTKDRI